MHHTRFDDQLFARTNDVQSCVLPGAELDQAHPGNGKKIGLCVLVVPVEVAGLVIYPSNSKTKCPV